MTSKTFGNTIFQYPPENAEISDITDAKDKWLTQVVYSPTIQQTFNDILKFINTISTLEPKKNITVGDKELILDQTVEIGMWHQKNDTRTTVKWIRNEQPMTMIFTLSDLTEVANTKSRNEITKTFSVKLQNIEIVKLVQTDRNLKCMNIEPGPWIDELPLFTKALIQKAQELNLIDNTQKERINISDLNIL